MVYEVDKTRMDVLITARCMRVGVRGVGMESRRCAEHGLSFLPTFWTMLFYAGAEGGLSLELELNLASILGVQMGSLEFQE